MLNAKCKISFIKLLIPVFIVVLISLACSSSANGGDSGLQKTEEALQNTAVALSVEGTRLAGQATQNASQPTQAPPAVQPTATTQAAQAGQKPTVQSAGSNAPTQQPTQQPQPPAQQPTAEPTIPPASGGHNTANDFYLVNNSSESVCYFFLSLSSSNDWGQDQLGSDIVYPTETYVLHDVPHGIYDIKLEDCNNTILSTSYSVEFPPNDTITLSGSNSSSSCGDGVCDAAESADNCPQDCPAVSGGQVALEIINNSDDMICYLWYGLPESEWAGDLLGNSTIPAWDSLVIMIDAGDYALSAEDCYGDPNTSQMMFTPRISVYGPTIWVVTR